MNKFYLYVLVIFGLILVWLGWKITAVTIVNSWLNEFGLIIEKFYEFKEKIIKGLYEN